jgi:hypothetical protein
MRITVLIAIGEIGTTMILNVLLRASAAIFKSAAFKIIELAILPNPLPAGDRRRRRRRLLSWLGVIQVIDSGLITAAESIAVSLAKFWRKFGAAVLVAILDVGLAMVFKVLARALDSVMEPALLGLVELARRRLPITVLGCSELCADTQASGGYKQRQGG